MSCVVEDLWSNLSEDLPQLWHAVLVRVEVDEVALGGRLGGGELGEGRHL